MSKEEDFVFPFEKLEVWRFAVEFTDYILGLLNSFPPNKYLRLIGQMEAAVTSSISVMVLPPAMSVEKSAGGVINV